MALKSSSPATMFVEAGIHIEVAKDAVITCRGQLVWRIIWTNHYEAAICFDCFVLTLWDYLLTQYDRGYPNKGRG